MKLVSMGLLLAISLIILMAGIVYGETEKVLSEKNEFGGKTVEIANTPEDLDYKLGMNHRGITYYDDNGKKRKLETLFINRDGAGRNREIEHYDSNGEMTKVETFYVNDSHWDRRIEYYDGKGMKTKEEVFYTDKYANEEGDISAISYYNGEGKKTKTETFYTGKYADEEGYNRGIHYYDGNEDIKTFETFYTDKHANEKGYNREIAYYAGNCLTKVETFYTDKHANEKGYNRRMLYVDSKKLDYYMYDRLIKTENKPSPASAEAYRDTTRDSTADSIAQKYQIRDGLTPQVILKLAKKAEKNKEIDESWLGELDVIYGHYTSRSGIEALVLSRNGQRSHAEVYTHVWLLGLQKGQWRLLRNVGAWDVVEAQVADVNGDGLDEVMLSCYGGNGFGYNVGMLYSFKGNRLDTLYRNEGHENWTWGFHPDYKKGILKRLYTVTFTSPDSAGMRTLVERQDLHMGRKISRESDDDSAAPDELYEETGKMKYITTRFHLINGHYRPIPKSAITTTKPVEMKEIPDAGVRISVPPDDEGE